MAKDVLYTNGAIAVKEMYLLKDKIFKLCEMSAEDAFRTLLESGFGGGSAAVSVYDYEQVAEADERALDGFIREYAPSAAEAEYLLSPRDFHNAKALVKAKYLGQDAGKMLAPEGLIPVQAISAAIDGGDYTRLGKELGGAVRDALALMDGAVSGAVIGGIFDRALSQRLARVCSKNRTLKKIIAYKADMTNIITALRADGEEQAEKAYLYGGKLTSKQLSRIFSGEADKAEHALDGTPYREFYVKSLENKRAGLPLTEAERLSDSYETALLSERKYELVNSQPFLYYVFRRRAEIANVRIIFVCLLAGMSENEIKKRLRVF